MKNGRITLGEKLLEGKTDKFKEEAIIRFTEFDRLMSLTNPDASFYVMGYPIIVANLEGEYIYRQEQNDRAQEEAQNMMAKITKSMSGMGM